MVLINLGIVIQIRRSSELPFGFFRIASGVFQKAIASRYSPKPMIYFFPRNSLLMMVFSTVHRGWNVLAP